MAKSISQAQKEFLSGGTITDYGTSRDTPFVPEESEKALIKLAGILITNARNNLQRSSQVSSGELSDSFQVVNPVSNDKIITLDIEALEYYDFQNKGVKGIRGGNSTGGYAFKNAFPSTEMVKSITGWMQRAGMSTANVMKPSSKLEKKNKNISQMDGAYSVARSIKIKGIRGSGYFDKAVKIAENYAEEVLGQALVIDIINTLPDRLNGTSNK